MKNKTKWIIIGLLIPLFFGISMVMGQEWNITEKDTLWSNVPKALTVVQDDKVLYNGKSSIRIEHKADKDWTVYHKENIPAQKGDIFEVSCYVKKEARSSFNISVVLLKGKEVLNWVYGAADQEESTDWKKITNRFVIPTNTDTIHVRLVGNGQGVNWVAVPCLRKIGSLNLKGEQRQYFLENDFLKLTFRAEDGSFNVLDKRTGRTWDQKTGNSFCDKVKKEAEEIKFSLIGTVSYSEFDIAIKLEKNRPEVIVSVDKEKSEPFGEVLYPLPFLSKKGDRLVVPMNEGISYPVDDEKLYVPSLIFYGGHGLCMSFYSVIEDKIGPVGGAGYMGIVETGDDAIAVFPRLKATSNVSEKEPPLLTAGVNWIPQKKVFGYKRVVRLVFFDKGGHVAACKRYREYAKQIGKYVPFTEKIKKNPNLKDGIDRLIGAANIWYFGPKPMEQVNEMRSLGMTNLLWSSSHDPQFIKEINEIPGMLSSRYDIYQDITDPSRINETGGGWTDPWPHDINWTDPNGSWRKGWGVRPKGDVKKEKPFIYCAVICDRQALPYAEKRIDKELKTKPYKARFIDTTVAAPWFECWHPDHPMTRTDSRIWKMKLLELLGQRFNLVSGSETGHDASVPYCDFYEGMMSLGPYRVPDSGRDLVDIWENPPERTRKFQVGEEYRLPLWELVYHDCVVSYWYWGDYNNKLPSLWERRDLFNALYGVPPMYLFVKDFWKKHQDRFVKSYKIAEPVSRLTGYAEMTDHQILTKDRSVQKTVFANGVEVIANFGSKSYTCSDGSVVAPMKTKVTKR